MTNVRCVAVVGFLIATASGQAPRAAVQQEPNLAPPRTASISGVVTTEDGRPIAGMPIHAARWLNEPGGPPMHNQLWPMEMATTDSEGRYTIRGLWASRVVVAAVPWEWPPLSADASARLVVPPISGLDGRPPTGLITTYFPGVTDALAARTLTIAAGPVEGINFVVRRGPLLEVAVRFNPPESANTRRPGATLTPASVPDRFGGYHLIRAAVRGGTHLFQYVPPGSYVLHYETADGWSHETVEVAPASTASLQKVFDLRPYFTVRGRLELHAAKGLLTLEERAAISKEIRVVLSAVPFLGGRSIDAVLESDGSFTISKVPGSTYSLLLAYHGPRDPRTGWQTVFSFLNGKDTWGSSAELRSDVTDARLIAADTQTLIHGVVHGAADAPPTLRVIVFPEDEALWRNPPEGRASNSGIDPQGRYAIRGIRPGRYYVTTIDTARFSFDRLAEAKASGPPFELGIGESKVVDVTVRR
jgi:hypothetical protein